MKTPGLAVLMGKRDWHTHAGSAKEAPQSTQGVFKGDYEAEDLVGWWWA